MRTQLRTWLTLLALLAAVGCADSQAIYVEHLAIININPSHGAVGIGYDTDINVMFSEVLAVESVNSSTICLTDDANPPPDPDAPCAGTVVPAQVSYDPANLSTRVDPSEALLPDMTYTLHITTGLQGENGTLPAIVRASFATIPTL